MKLGLIFFAACAVACASDPLRPLSPKASEPQWDGLDRPQTCSAETLRTFSPSLGTVRVVRQTAVTAPGRAVVASEPYSCEGLERTACIARAEQHAQRRAFWLGLSTRLAPTDVHRPQIEIQYIEPKRRDHSLPAADIDYELPWGERSQRQALNGLSLELDRHGLELDEKSERDVTLALTQIGTEPYELDSEDGDPEEAARLAMPRIAAAPRVVRLHVRCQADSGGRARATHSER